MVTLSEQAADEVACSHYTDGEEMEMTLDQIEDAAAANHGCLPRELRDRLESLNILRTASNSEHRFLAVVRYESGTPALVIEHDGAIYDPADWANNQDAQYTTLWDEPDYCPATAQERAGSHDATGLLYGVSEANEVDEANEAATCALYREIAG